jgi:hypothetical protein
MVFTALGYLGIGTNAPTNALTIVSKYNPLSIKSTYDGCYAELFTPGYTGSSSRAGWFGFGSGTTTDLTIANETTSGSIKFGTNLVTRMIVTSDGAVAIGTTAPWGKLHVNNDVTGSDSSFVVKTDGKVGIGTNSPSAKLEVVGSVKITDGTQGAGKVLTSDASGNASWQSSSAGGAFSNMQVYATAGTFTFTIPAGITKILVEVWGAGGGGGVASTSLGNVALGGGGGGYGKDIFTVSSGTQYVVTVGLGGVAGTVSAHGGNGGASSLGTIITASGGIGGASVGVTPYQWGVGGSSSAVFNIYGKNSGYTNNGGDSFGGSGGMGATNGLLASPGISPGGGGAGGHSTTGYTSGAAGGVGRVVIYY